MLLQYQGKSIGWIMVNLKSIETIKSIGEEDNFFTRIAGLSAETLAVEQRMGRMEAVISVLPTLLTSILTALIFTIGSEYVLMGAMTIGTFVAFNTLMTGFTVIASLEKAGRVAGGKGLFGWIGALRWSNPMVLSAILAFLMLKMTGVDREVIEKWLYAIVALSLFTGVLGTGHHYYWIGTPAYWQWIGSIFSSLEVLPFFAMVLFTFDMVWKRRREHPNNAALLWALGCAVLAFFGAGVWGFMHTLHGVNYYTHGTQVTAAHGHLAFFGAYVSLNLAVMSYAIPHLRGLPPYNQVLNMVSFWVMSSAMAFMTFTLTFAGVVQTHLQRVLGQDYMSVQDQLQLFYLLRVGSGAVVVVGAILFIWSILGPAKSELVSRDASAAPAE